MNVKTMITGFVSIVIGLVLLPVMAWTKTQAVYNYNASDVMNVPDPNVSAIAGLSSIMDLVLYGFSFGLIGVGIALIWKGYKD